MESTERRIPIRSSHINHQSNPMRAPPIKIPGTASSIWTEVAESYVGELPVHTPAIRDYITTLSELDDHDRYLIDLTNDQTFHAQQATLGNLTRGFPAGTEVEPKCKVVLEAARFCQVWSNFSRSEVREVPERPSTAPPLSNPQEGEIELMNRISALAASTRAIARNRVGGSKLPDPPMNKCQSTEARYIRHLEYDVRDETLEAIPYMAGYDPLRDSVNSLCDATRRFYVRSHYGKTDRPTLEETKTYTSRQAATSALARKVKRQEEEASIVAKKWAASRKARPSAGSRSRVTEEAVLGWRSEESKRWSTQQRNCPGQVAGSPGLIDNLHAQAM